MEKRGGDAMTGKRFGRPRVSLQVPEGSGLQRLCLPVPLGSPSCYTNPLTYCFIFIGQLLIEWLLSR